MLYNKKHYFYRLSALSKPLKMKEQKILNPHFTKSKTAWFKELCGFVAHDTLSQIGIQAIVWECFYVIWRVNTGWRYFSDQWHEHYSFFLIPAGIYLFYFVAYKLFYRKNKLTAFFGITMLIAGVIIVAEYHFIIGTILNRIPTTLAPDIYATSVSDYKMSTWWAITLRDFAIFAIVGFGLIYRDAMQHYLDQKKQLKLIRQNELLSHQLRNHLVHNHFMKNISMSYMGSHPESKDEIKEILFLFSFSLTYTDNIFYPVQEEIKFARSLVAFFQKQHPGLPIQFDVKNKECKAYILPLVCEPLICNMFAHGVVSQEGMMQITFDFTDPAMLTMEFINKIKPEQAFSFNPHSQGLKLLRERLKLTYNEEASVEESVENDRVTVLLSIVSLPSKDVSAQ